MHAVLGSQSRVGLSKGDVVVPSIDTGGGPPLILTSQSALYPLVPGGDVAGLAVNGTGTYAVCDY
jgi:hypothetical protein